MAVMSDCKSSLFNVSNHQKFKFTKADTHSSVETFEGGEKGVYFNANGSNTELAISVFNYGDKGNLFYIILSGQIEVWSPQPVILLNRETTPYGIVSFIVTFFN